MRGIVGPVFAMARPARPSAEVDAVYRAFRLVQREGCRQSVRSIARHIAKRVVEIMFLDLMSTDSDPFAAAVREARHALSLDPFYVLAKDPVINTVDDLIRIRISRVRADQGRLIVSVQEDTKELSRQLRTLLAGRYARIAYASGIRARL